MNPDGITEWIFWFGQPDFTLVGNPFGFWMEQTHPDVADQLEFGAWESVEEAEETGLLTAQYAKEWADYLEANGCLDGDGPLDVRLRC